MQNQPKDVASDDDDDDDGDEATEGDSDKHDLPKSLDSRPAKNSKPNTLADYSFVNEPDEDDQFRPYVGLDIRRVKSHMRALQALAEKDAINSLRERERRTRLRQLKKQSQDAKAEPGLEDESDDEPL